MIGFSPGEDPKKIKMEPTRVTSPLSRSSAQSLRVGDEVLISGVVYTARDAAHTRLVSLIEKEKPLPFPLENQIIYYTAPTPARPGRPLGSCGPTTSARMDRYTPYLLSKGLRGTIGKGQRSRAVREALNKYKAVYFLTLGGAGAYLSKRVKRVEIAAFSDLGPEAVYKLGVEDFPAIVGIDTTGADLYENLWMRGSDVEKGRTLSQ